MKEFDKNLPPFKPVLDENNDPTFIPLDNAPDMTELNEMLRAMNESEYEYDREFVTALVGNETGPHGFQTITVKRGEPSGTIWPNGESAEDGIIHKYNAICDCYCENYNGQKGYDIGLVEDAWFVIADDCVAIEPNADNIGDEWNALMNNRPKEQIEEIWKRRKISFYEFWGRVLDMKI